MARDKDGKLIVTAEKAEEMKGQLRDSVNFSQMSPEKQAEYDRQIDALMDERVTISNENASNTTSDEEDDEMDAMQERTGPGEGKGGPSRDDDDDLEL